MPLLCYAAYRMHCNLRLAGVFLAAGFFQACAVAPAPDPEIPGLETRKMVAQRLSAVVVTNQASLRNWASRSFSSSQTPGDADGGSATPISHDGYFLTADHVLAQVDGRNVFVLYGNRGRLIQKKARVVWRSQSADLALLHIPEKTPYYYRWTPAERWLPVGTGVVHGGIATGFKSAPGKLGTPISPESFLTGNRVFKIDIPLQPGDSGGPVVDAYGGLVGINSAVEFLIPMETAFFVDSEANRPSIRKIESIIQMDRGRNIGSSSGVE